MNSIRNYFGPWLSKPFDPDMDYIDWVLFVVFLLTVAYVWKEILRYITEDI